MFISNEALLYSLRTLESLHPFYGITYLVCKKHGLPKGRATEFPINHEETQFLNEYYKPIKKTEKFFRVFRTSEKSKYWLNSDYASSGSQATRTQIFSDAFIHPKNSNLWGWANDYVETLGKHLNKKKIPAYSLALWILKDKEWPSGSNISDVLTYFVEQFNISFEEVQSLFDDNIPEGLDDAEFFSLKPYNWNYIADILEIPYPPDAPLEKGAALKSLDLKGIEPSKHFHLDFNNRLNIITGDNGLGKSFILETAWWALTQNWTSYPVFPKRTLEKSEPSIGFNIAVDKGRSESYTAHFDWRLQNWFITKKDKKTVPGLVIYARVDGAFAIWDPARMQVGNKWEEAILASTLIFSREDVWDGVRIGEGNKARSIFNGLITDWVHWQTTNSEAFEILKKVLKRLSPPDLSYGDLGILEPGEIVRIPGESRPMPTIKHPYGEVPLVFSSAAIRRIVAFAYLIVWTWEEHKTSAELMREKTQRKMVVIADEIEAHLHPQWQRIILPALTSISDDLSDNLDIQFIITTHSPLVMASIEPLYDESIDKIFHLNLKRTKQEKLEIVLETPPFERRGSADSWLISDIFELKQPRSIEAENFIERAKALQVSDNPDKDEILLVSKKLTEVLPPHDTFWVRWNYFAEKNGVKL